MLLRWMILGTSLLFASGCTFLGITEQKTLKQQEVGESLERKDTTNRLDVLSFPTQLRGAYAYRNSVNIGTNDAPKWESRYVVCAEPFADIGMSSSLETTLALVNDLATTSNSSSDYTRDNNRSATLKRKVETSTVNEDGTVTTTTTSDYETDTEQTTTAEGQRSLNLTSTGKQRAEAGLEASSTAVELGGRTQYVVLAREMLYRTCEMAAAGFLNPSTVESQHTSIINALTKMLAAEEKKAEATKVAADAALTQQTARLVEGLTIADFKPSDIPGSGTDPVKQLLMQKLGECDDKFAKIEDDAERKKKENACRENLIRQITILDK